MAHVTTIAPLRERTLSGFYLRVLEQLAADMTGAGLAYVRYETGGGALEANRPPLKTTSIALVRSSVTRDLKT